MPSRVVVFNSDKFALVSYGNGMSYALHNHRARRSLFVQGDDATTLREEIESWERVDPDKPYDEIYAEVWSDLAPVA
jgi:hypothetical protein